MTSKSKTRASPTATATARAATATSATATSTANGTVVKALIAGFVLRVAVAFALQGSQIASSVRGHVLLSTPHTSYRRLSEGIFLSRHGVPLTESDVSHPWLLLSLFTPIVTHLPEIGIDAVFAAIDCFVAYALFVASQALLSGAGRTRYQSLVAPLPLKFFRLEAAPLLYLFNPISILTCLARSTLPVTHLAVAMSLASALGGRRWLAMAWLSIASYLDLYPSALLPAVIFILRPRADLAQSPSSSSTAKSKSKSKSTTSILNLIEDAASVIAFGIGILMLLNISSTDSASILGQLRSIWWPLISVEDLTPNVGMWWYLLIEMFDHFRSFFVSMLQLYIVIFIGPISYKFRDAPIAAFVINTGILAAFKSYPSLSDFSSFFVSLLPLVPELFAYLKYTQVNCIVHLVAVVLMPVSWYAWIVAGSANANFYYAATLVYALSCGMLLADLVIAKAVHDFDTAHEAKDKIVVQE